MLLEEGVCYDQSLVLPSSNRAPWVTTLDFLYLDFLFSCMLSHFSHVQHPVTLWTVACQSPLSMRCSRQEYWSGLPFPSLVHFGHWNAKVGSQELPEVTGKFGLGVQNEAGQRLTVLPRECTGHSKHPFPTTQDKTLHMDITK